MLLTDKVFFASTLCSAVGCSTVTFRSWRNRNGLFPETQSSGVWNRFSIVDVLVASVAYELTRGGIGAQTAVEAAMKASGALIDLCGFSKGDKEKDVTDVVLRILKKWPIRTEFPVLTVGRTLGHEHVLCVEMKKPTEMPILRVFEVPGPEDPIPLVVSIVYLARLLPDILMALIFDEADCGRTRYPTELSSRENAVKFFGSNRVDD
jgi:hypothetical protein